MQDQSILKTDGYKFSMAEAGFPLRTETFYYTHRKGGINGWHYMPIDMKDYIKCILPTTQSLEDYAFLDANSYSVGAAVRKAYTLIDTVNVTSIPEGSWFYNKEPAFSATGPSALASWLEPMTIMINFMIQVATQGKINNFPDKINVTCEAEGNIIKETCDYIKKRCPEIVINPEQYYQNILIKAKALVDVVKNPDRIFEVGMRGVSCMEQHEIALSAIKEAGILRTSNVYLAKKLGMIPVGTMGHEHPERFGADYPSYTGMRDRFPGFISYLPDTYDSIKSGIPSAIKAIMETPDRKAGIRFDCEDKIKNHYLYTLTEFQRLGINQMLILEGGWNLEKTILFEKLRETFDWPMDLQSYGFGGYLVDPLWRPFLRDDVAAIWKLCESNGPRMKFGDDAGAAKQSIPGNPVTYRPMPISSNYSMPIGIIGQAGEIINDYYPLSNSAQAGLDPDLKRTNNIPPKYSKATQAFIDICKSQRQANIING